MRGEACNTHPYATNIGEYPLHFPFTYAIFPIIDLRMRQYISNIRISEVAVGEFQGGRLID